MKQLGRRARWMKERHKILDLYYREAENRMMREIGESIVGIQRRGQKQIADLRDKYFHELGAAMPSRIFIDANAIRNTY